MATTKRNNNRMQPNMRARALAAAVSAAVMPWALSQSAFAQTAANTVPTNGVYVAGDGRILPVTPENYLRIEQASQKGIIEWGTFSIGSAAHVHFQQAAGAQGLTLNRVVGNSASEIFGRLTSNGQLFLVNNAGVLFAPGARVEVGALFASSLSITNEDFLAGRYVFSNPGNAGSVINQGQIVTANGYTALAGPQVRNDGVIVAHRGSVALAAGDRVALDLIGDGLISVSVDQSTLNASVIHTGTIEADGGLVLLAARSANALLDSVINSNGVIRANSLVARNGEIVLDGGSAGLVSVIGTLQTVGVDAGTTGGTVKVLGQYVGLFDNASIDVSGSAGGGIALVGGNYQGGGPEQNALRTFVASGVNIHADAITTGNGGRVVIWADDTTAYYGHISARGGAQRGNGGFAEVSGKQQLAFRGTADLSAPNGSLGTLLLDPATLTIIDQSAGVGAQDINLATGNDILAGDVDLPGNTVSEPALEGLLSTANVILEATGQITVDNLSTDGVLNMAQTGAGSFRMTSTTSGGITFVDATNTIQTAGADITLQAQGTGSLSNIGNLNSNGGAIALQSATSIQLNGAVSAGAGNVTLTAGTAVTQSATAVISGSTLILQGAGATYSLDTANNAVTSLDANNNQLAALSFRDDSGFSVAGIDSAGAVTLQSNGTVSQTAPITAPTLTLAASTVGSGDFTLTDAGNALGTVSSTNAVNSLSLRDDAGFALGNISAATLNLQSDGTVDGSGGAITATNVNVTASTAGSGTFTLSNAGNVIGTMDTTNSVNTLTVRDDGGLTLGATIDAATLNLQSDGAVDGTGSAITATNVNLAASNAGSGTFTLNNAGNALGTVSSTNAVDTVSLRDEGGFALGGISAATLNLQSNGTVDGSGGAITATNVNVTASTAGSGTFTLSNAGNAIGTVDTTNSVNTLTVRDDGGLTLAATIDATTLNLQSDGTVDASASVITATNVNLTASTPGSGDFTLTNAGNALGTVGSTNTVNSVSLRDDGGFVLGSLAADGTVALQTDGAVTQSGALTGAAALTLISAGGTGDFTLTNAGNDLGSVASSGSVDVVSLRDDGGFSLGALTVSSLALQTNGTITQTGALTTPTLTFTASTVGSGDFTLTNAGNALGTVSSTNTVNSVSLRDDGGFTLGALAADSSVSLQTDAAVTQSGALTGAAAVTLISAAGTGDFTLTHAGNDLGSMASSGSVDVVSLRDDGGFALGALTVSSLALQTNGTITQTGGLSAPTVTLTASTPGSGDFTLTNAGNALGTVSSTNTVNSVSLRDDGGFALGPITTDTSVTVESVGGTVTQTGAVTAPTLTLQGAGGAFTLDTQNNSVTTLDGNNTTLAALSFRDDNGFAVAGIDASGAVTLQTGAATVTQSAAINASTLTLKGVGATYTLGTQNNAISTLDANDNQLATLSFKDDSGFAVAGIDSAGAVTLESAGGTVTQSGTISATTLTLQGAGGNFNLGTQNNTVGVLDANNAALGALSFRDDGGIVVAGVNATAAVNLVSNGGAITQSAPIVAGGTTSVSAGAAAITLTNAANNFGGAVTLSNSGSNAVQLTDGTGGVSVAASTVGGDFIVTSTGGAITLTGGNYNTTSNGVFTMNGNVVLGGDTTVNTGSGNTNWNGTINGGFSLTVNDSGTNTFAGAIGNTTALANITTDQPGSSSLAGNVRVTGAINLLDATTANGLTMTSTAGGSVTVNNANATSPGTIATSGPVTLGGPTIGSPGDPLDFTVTPSALTMTQEVVAYFAGPAIPNSVVFPANSSITFNGATIAQSILQQQASNAAGNASQAVTAAIVEEANKTFGTDSVAEDVEYGFAGEIGATPPMDHRIDDSGISVPRCLQEAREGLPCK